MTPQSDPSLENLELLRRAILTGKVSHLDERTGLAPKSEPKGKAYGTVIHHPSEGETSLEGATLEDRGLRLQRAFFEVYKPFRGRPTINKVFILALIYKYLTSRQ